jgi:cell division septum initiation protein DivIVA
MSNLDPVGTQGLGRRTSDLEAAWEGGGDYNSRVQLLSAKKEAADAALKALNLGNDIAAARADVEKNRADAASLHEKASTLVAEARKEAQRILDEASASAQATVDAAQATAKAKVGAADKVKADADTYAASAKKAADSLRSDAEAHNAKALELRTALEKATNEHVAAIAAATHAQDQAEQTRATLQAHIDKLHGVLNEIAG